MSHHAVRHAGLGLLWASIVVAALAPAAGAEPDPQRHAAVDAYIAGRLTTAYALSEPLAGYPLEVSVREGVVQITGVVENEVLRELAVEIARGVENVREIEASQLQVTPGTAPVASSAYGFRGRFADAALTARVKTRLLWNDNTKGLAIHVDTRERVVTLSGEVGSAAEQALARQIAVNTDGVRSVDNRLRVTPPRPLAGSN